MKLKLLSTILVLFITSCVQNINSELVNSTTSSVQSLPNSSNVEVPIKNEIKLTDNFSDLNVCKIEDTVKDRFSTITFPRRNMSLPSTGEIRIGVVYVDFADYRWKRTETTTELTKFIMSDIEDYYNKMSNGEVNISWVISDYIVKMNSKVTDYDLARDQTTKKLDFKREFNPFIDLAIDTTLIDVLFVAINPDIPEEYSDYSPMWNGNEEFWYYRKITSDGYYYLNHFSIIGMDTRRIGAGTMVHEIGHMFGLPDLYTVFYERNPNDPNDWFNQFIYMGRFGLMNHVTGGASELLSWERWLIGWIKNDEARCIDKKETHILEIVPSYSDQAGVKLVSINLTSTKNIVIEVKEKNEYCEICDLGALVYTVDSSLPSMRGPVRMVVPNHSKDRLFADGLLSAKTGQNFVKFENWEIRIIEESAKGLIIEIKNN
jgi:M6 family metalloprotease-like protein